jgi:hypothetical protein
MAPPPNLEILLVQLQYPGMPAPESEVTRDWLVKRGAEFDRIEFNVRLGKGDELGEEFNASTRKLAAAVSTKRADIIAWRENSAYILEAKWRCGLGALGQLLGYRVLFLEQFPTIDDVFLQVIARKIDGDVELALRAHGIQYELFPRVSRV